MNALILWVSALVLAPFYAGLIQKVKAFFGGRQGAPLLINYYTLFKLLKKGSVYSLSTSFLFRLSPLITLGAALFALLLFPMGGMPALVSFQGDVILLFYLFGLARFCTILAGLDTASPFQGMGTAREAYFAVFIELALFMILILFYRLSGNLSLSGILNKSGCIDIWRVGGPPLILVIFAIYIILLTENARVPVDDPATHLELTMIHEVMVLDHSGPDLAFIEFAAHLKLIFYAAFLVCLLFPFRVAHPFLDMLIFWGVLGLVYIVVGVTESVMARFKLPNVPKFLLTAFALVFFAMVVILEVEL